MIREICFFAVTMLCVGLYVAWRERRVRGSLQRTIAANVGAGNPGPGNPGAGNPAPGNPGAENPEPQQAIEFGAVMQLAVGAGPQRSLKDQRLLAQVNQLLTLRG
jgi:hypothetical protein